MPRSRHCLGETAVALVIITQLGTRPPVGTTSAYRAIPIKSPLSVGYGRAPRPLPAAHSEHDISPS